MIDDLCWLLPRHDRVEFVPVTPPGGKVDYEAQGQRSTKKKENKEAPNPKTAVIVTGFWFTNQRADAAGSLQAPQTLVFF